MTLPELWTGSEKQHAAVQAEIDRLRKCIVLKPQAIREAIQRAVLESRQTRNLESVDMMGLVEEIMDVIVDQNLKENG